MNSTLLSIDSPCEREEVKRLRSGHTGLHRTYSIELGGRPERSARSVSWKTWGGRKRKEPRWLVVETAHLRVLADRDPGALHEDAANDRVALAGESSRAL